MADASISSQQPFAAVWLKCKYTVEDSEQSLAQRITAVTTQLSLLHIVARESNGAQGALCRRLERQLMRTYRSLTQHEREASMKKAAAEVKQTGAAKLTDLRNADLAKLIRVGQDSMGVDSDAEAQPPPKKYKWQRPSGKSSAAAMSVPGSAAAAAAAADPAETERLKAKQTALGKQVAFLRTQLLQRTQELDKMKLSLRDTQNQLQQQQQQTTQGRGRQPGVAAVGSGYRRTKSAGAGDLGGSFESDDDAAAPGGGNFVTAGQQLAIDNAKRNRRGGSSAGGGGGGGGGGYHPANSVPGQNAGQRRAAGLSRPGRGRNNPGYVPPFARDEQGGQAPRDAGNEDADPANKKFLQSVDEPLVERIKNEIMINNPNISWDDIAGLDAAKKAIQELVIWPMLRPDIFTGLRSMPKGVLLFGPPGTGKTLIGKCIASQSKATFFSISASSLTSKWIGDGEKLVRALFAVARDNLPAVIFIDEIDSLLTQRSEQEHESSRRIKTEFLVQLDGATTSMDEHLLIVGATNRPQELDEAARRRLPKRLYIPLPDSTARRQLVVNLLKDQNQSLTDEDLNTICKRSEGYSGSDMSYVCKEAALGPVRDIHDIASIAADNVREIRMEDFDKALRGVRPSVSEKEIEGYIAWDNDFGSHVGDRS